MLQWNLSLGNPLFYDQLPLHTICIWQIGRRRLQVLLYLNALPGLFCDILRKLASRIKNHKIKTIRMVPYTLTKITFHYLLIFPSIKLFIMFVQAISRKVLYQHANYCSFIRKHFTLQHFNSMKSSFIRCFCTLELPPHHHHERRDVLYRYILKRNALRDFICRGLWNPWQFYFLRFILRGFLFYDTEGYITFK